jgi:glycosyltransferase involved in cell wall biosynthesis
MPASGLVSVIIPCYNQAHFLREAIESALAQTYSNREIIVVDDGSSDSTATVARRYSLVRYVYQQNAGPSAARNTGLKQSHGEYLVFLDADDRLLPEALEIGVDCLRQHPECAFASGFCRLIVADGSLLSKPEQPYILQDHYLKFLRRNYIWCPSSVVYKRSILETVKGFNTSLGRGEDYDLFLRITRDHPIFCHNQFVADYRLHGSSRSADHSLMLRDTLNALNAQWDFAKGSDRYIQAFEAGINYLQGRYQFLQIADRILGIVEANLPPDSSIAVVTSGKNELLKLGDRRAWHFPQADASEPGRLFQQGAEGSADVPWIEAGMRYEFRLFGGPKYSKQLAAISVTGLAGAEPGVNMGPVPSGQLYLLASPNPVPAPNRFGRTTISWNTGDGSIGRIYLSQGGAYDSSSLWASSDAISRLEAIRARGAQYLLLPATAFWWLDRYQKFREHLEAHCPVVVRDEDTCVIFDLRWCLALPDEPAPADATETSAVRRGEKAKNVDPVINVENFSKRYIIGHRNGQQFVVRHSDLKVSQRRPGISGYLRVRNEEQFLALAIESHLPFLDELVIVYNACTDRTSEIAAEYAQRYPDKVRVFHYEPEAYPPGTTEFVNLPPDSPHSLVNYYNFTLCQTTCRVAMKVDADHVIIPERINSIIRIVRSPWLHPYYHFPRFNCFLGYRGLNLWDQNGKFFVNLREPVTEYHGLFPISERTWFRHDPRWEILESGDLRHFHICHYGFYHVRFLKVEREQWLKDYQKIPHPDLYKDEMDCRLQPQLVPLEEYCANHPDAHGLPHPSRFGIVAPQRVTPHDP